MFSLLFILIANTLFAQVPQITPDLLREYKIGNEIKVIDTKSVHVEYKHESVPEKHIKTSGVITFKKPMLIKSINMILVLFDEKKEPVYLVNFSVISLENKTAKFVGLYEENPAYKYYVIILDITYDEPNKV